MAIDPIVLPGEDIPSHILPIPSKPNKALKLGSGLHHTPPSTVTATQAGPLGINHKKHSIWVENHGGRYIPQPTDLILATIHHSAAESYQCSLTPHTPFAQLPHLSFESATKKTRPQLSHGSLVYARVVSASKFADPEITCVDPATGRGDGLGELKGGMVFEVGRGFCGRLLAPGGKAKGKDDDGGEGKVVVLEELGQRLAFEVAVGRNGKVWVKGEGVRETMLVGRALKVVEEEGLGVEEQRKVVRRLVKGL